MQILDDKTDLEIMQSLLAELAKAQNEIACARKDLEKAQGRQKFLLVLAHEMIRRQGDTK